MKKVHEVVMILNIYHTINENRIGIATMIVVIRPRNGPPGPMARPSPARPGPALPGPTAILCWAGRAS